MTDLNIINQRLNNQRITGNLFEKPEEVVQWLGAVQSQDYGGAKWAIAQRTRNISDEVINQVFNEGKILRTHVLRPTWHFVMPEDIRWMLKLTAPRIKASIASMLKKLELDQKEFASSNAVLEKTLAGGKHLTREELGEAFRQANIDVSDLLRLTHLVMWAELEGIICSGALRGKQHTYALLEERVRPVRVLEHEEALAELARRYITSHGPATLKDYSWWSGLSAADARASFEAVKSEFIQETLDGQTYWLAETALMVKDVSPTVYLLPNYDEYVVGYTDRKAIFDNIYIENMDATNNLLFSYTIVIDGRISGTWKRTFKKKEVLVEVSPFARLSEGETRALMVAVENYSRFVGLPVKINI